MSQLSEQILYEVEDLSEDLQREVIDFVQFLKIKRQKQKSYDNQQIMTLLQEGRQKGLFADIDDPSAWQTEIRADRPLPNRS